MCLKLTNRRKVALGVTIFYSLILPTVVFAGNGHGGCLAPHGEYTIVLYNCIKGKTLYPKIRYAHITPASHLSNIVLKGPSGGAQCGPGVTVVNDVYTSGHLNWWHTEFDADTPSFIFIGGLNGGAFILAGNIGDNDKVKLPDGTNITVYGNTWASDGGMAFGFVSNRNNQRLPYNAKCPAGSTKKGGICLYVKHSVYHTCLGTTEDPYYEAHVYIFSANPGTHAGLPNLPSTSGS